MTDAALKNDIEAMYRLADGCKTLPELMPALCDVLSRHQTALSDVTYSYRLKATDTGYECAFSLDHGRYAALDASASTDVTVTGKQEHLLAVFQHKLNPAMALVLRKIKVSGSLAALEKLASFL